MAHVGDQGVDVGIRLVLHQGHAALAHQRVDLFEVLELLAGDADEGGVVRLGAAGARS